MFRPTNALHPFLFLIACATLVAVSAAAVEKASVASISPRDLVEFDEQPEEIKTLIREALALTTKKLTYRFGSNTPENRGMDCSGTVQFTLKSVGIGDVPRSSYTIYQWAKSQGAFTETNGVESTTDPILRSMKPGDLLFWAGTYDTSGRNPPISHVMIYLGRLKKDGQGVVFGASDGRRFRGQRIRGVSVFDWKIPPQESKSEFHGFAPIPGLVAPPREKKKRKGLFRF